MKQHAPRRMHPVVWIAGWLACVGLIFQLVPSPPAASATGEQVEVWITLADGSKKLQREADLSFSPGAGSGTTITVDPSVLYQQLEGLGAALTDSSAWLISDTLSVAQREELLERLFTRDGAGIGLNYLRLPMGASDFALSSYTYDDMPVGQSDPTLANFSVAHDQSYIIPVLQQAKALTPGLKLMGSPWSAPAWMKQSGSLNGGALKSEYYQAFANYHVKFAQAYAAAGLPIDALTPQNEPMHSTSSYPSMSMSAAEQLAFVKDNLGPALQTAGLSPKLLILDHNWDLTNYALAVLSDPAARAYIDGTAFHCYAGQVANQSLVYSAYPDKGIWFTECSGGDWSTNFGDNMSWNLRNLVIGNLRNWGKSLLLWNLALDENDGPKNGGCGNCRGVVTINSGDGAVTYNEEYYILGHVSKFVDAGAYRAKSTAYAEGGPENVALLNPDGSLALVVHATTAQTFTVSWNGEHFSYALPAKGTVTFKWQTGSGPGPTVTPEATPSATTQPVATPRPHRPGKLQDFEAEGSYYSVYQVAPSLSTSIRYSGQSALRSFSDSGQWHTVGIYLNGRPINATAFEQICFWVYDTTAADNTIGVRLVDSSGASQERWTDHAEIGSNPKTRQNEWVKMCLKLTGYDLINLAALEKIELAVYWAGDYYFDDVIGIPYKDYLPLITR